MAIGTGLAILGGSLIGGGASIIGSGMAASGAKKGAGIQAQAQMAQLDYLKQINELPQQYKEQALTELNGIFNPETGQYEFPQEQLLQQAKASPLYGSIMQGQQAGEDAIMRHAGATGGLRSGNVQDALSRYSGDLQNRALLQSYANQVQQYQYGMSGLQGLAQLPTNENQIGQTMADIGGTQAQGQIAAGQAWQSGLQGMGNAFGSGVGNFLWAKGKGLI